MGEEGKNKAWENSAFYLATLFAGRRMKINIRLSPSVSEILSGPQLSCNLSQKKNPLNFTGQKDRLMSVRRICAGRLKGLAVFFACKPHQSIRGVA
jgi:hypothetical protein